MDHDQTYAPEYLTKSDLIRRWAWSPLKLEKYIASHRTFPKPAGTIGGGKIKIWTLSTIKKFEDMEKIVPSYARLFSKQQYLNTP